MKIRVIHSEHEPDMTYECNHFRVEGEILYIFEDRETENPLPRQVIKKWEYFEVIPDIQPEIAEDTPGPDA